MPSRPACTAARSRPTPASTGIFTGWPAGAARPFPHPWFLAWSPPACLAPAKTADRQRTRCSPWRGHRRCPASVRCSIHATSVRTTAARAAAITAAITAVTVRVAIAAVAADRRTPGEEAAPRAGRTCITVGATGERMCLCTRMRQPAWPEPPRLATTARREALRVARGSARVIPTQDTAVFDRGHAEVASPEQAVLDAEQAAIDRERAKQLWRAFDQISARCQELLRVLIATPPPTYAEVAAALDMPVGSVGPTRARCLQKLRRLAGEVSETV